MWTIDYDLPDWRDLTWPQRLRVIAAAPFLFGGVAIAFVGIGVGLIGIFICGRGR